LHMDEAVKLIGITSMINRPVPNFQLISPFVVRYPLQLIDPIHVGAVALRDHSTIQWTVRP
jgi:hypothetical protein